ncbi:MAG: methyltransferase domain-containing protein [Nanoarchaeota archaeon]
MSKIIIKPQKKQFIEHINKEVVISTQETIFVTNENKDFSTKHGIIKKEEFTKPDGSIVTSSTGTAFILLTPTFIDHYQRIKRLPQTIPLKDIGWIIAKTGIGTESIAVDAGCGSGALALTLARHAKHVITYDLEEEHLSIAKQNATMLGITNITFKIGDATKHIDEHNVDIVTLDLPNPWEAIQMASLALRIGGFLVSYSPTIPQTIDFVNSIFSRKEFIIIEVVEIIERPWEVTGRKVRPISKETIHSGFLTLARKIT